MRALGVGEVRVGDVFRVLSREVLVGLMLAAAMSVAAFVGAQILGVGPEIGEVVALTAFFIVVWSAIVASVLPLVLTRLRLDPAVVSGPLIATLVDGTRLVIYFTVAKAVLRLSSARPPDTMELSRACSRADPSGGTRGNTG